MSDDHNHPERAYNDKARYDMARDLIRQGEYAAARALLATIDRPQARQLLERLPADKSAGNRGSAQRRLIIALAAALAASLLLIVSLLLSGGNNETQPSSLPTLAALADDTATARPSIEVTPIRKVLLMWKQPPKPLPRR
ncbi:tetratricopeptide repeat protein, partial [bacterium]|nr:tetratricopeptide repeat protein [bacterium]